MSTLAKVNAKAFAAASFCMATKDVRYYLNGVYIKPLEGGGVECVGTDGHRMIIVTDPNGSCDVDEGIIVWANPATITKMKAKTYMDVEIKESDEDGEVMIVVTGMGKKYMKHIAQGTLADGKYPDYRSVMPKKLPDNSTSTVIFNAKLLSAFVDAAKVMGKGRTYSGMALVNGGANDSICIRFAPLAYDLHAQGIVMPLKDELIDWNY